MPYKGQTLPLETLSGGGFFCASLSGVGREGGSGDTPETTPGPAPLDPAAKNPSPENLRNCGWVGCRGEHLQKKIIVYNIWIVFF